MDNRPVTIRGKAYGGEYNYECSIESWSPNEAIFIATNSPREHRFVVSPRAGLLGVADHADGTTTCNVTMDNTYNSIGYYKETDTLIEIIASEW